MNHRCTLGPAGVFSPGWEPQLYGKQGCLPPRSLSDVGLNGAFQPVAILLTRRATMSDSHSSSLHRRDFLKASGLALGAAGMTSLSACAATDSAAPAASKVKIAKGATVLFQGDSITDSRRKRKPEDSSVPNRQPGMGDGYAWLAAAELLVTRPADELKIFNRGISGNKVFQLADRWQADCLDLKPDVLSILIGVNDLWHTFANGYTGTVEKYEADYLALIERTRQALPTVKFIVCEPFVLRCGVVTARWFPDFDKYRAAAKRVAEKQHTVFVPFQAMFDEAIKYAPPEHWAADGVHPTPAGGALMAGFWLNTVVGAR
jgi:lysophospholipase L1-like esterase